MELDPFHKQGLLGGRKPFQKAFVDPISQGRNEAAERLRQRVRPFVLRRLKRDVLPELPPKTEVQLNVTMTEAEKATYEAVSLGVRQDVQRMLDEKNMMAALEALLRLRQAACHQGLLPGRSGEKTAGKPGVKHTGSSKVERLVENLIAGKENGHRALVFSQWTGFLDLIEPALTLAGISFGRLDGSTPIPRGPLSTDSRRRTARMPC